MVHSEKIYMVDWWGVTQRVPQLENVAQTSAENTVNPALRPTDEQQFNLRIHRLLLFDSEGTHLRRRQFNLDSISGSCDA